MRPEIIYVCTIILMVACSQPENPEESILTETQRSQIEKYAVTLVNSINNFDFHVINQTWSNKAFKERITNLTETQKSVFDHIFEEDIRQTIKTGNLSIIHSVKENNGAAELLNLRHFVRHTEIILLLKYNGWISFHKYRIEYRNGQPVLSDHYQYTEDLWFSEKIKVILKLNSKYADLSKTTSGVYNSWDRYQHYLNTGDNISALKTLNSIPRDFFPGNWLILNKLERAAEINDSVYTEVLNEEYTHNRSLFIRYLHNYDTGDIVNYIETQNLLLAEFGTAPIIDSLINEKVSWY